MVNEFVISKLEEKLKIFNYSYVRENNIISIRFRSKIVLRVEFTDEQILIKNRIEIWNPASGIIPSSLKGLLVLSNFSWILIFAYIHILNIYQNEDIIINHTNIVSYLIVFGVIHLLWVIFYIVKINSLKNRIIYLINEML